jgi:hypothetical protein
LLSDSRKDIFATQPHPFILPIKSGQALFLKEREFKPFSFMRRVWDEVDFKTIW